MELKTGVDDAASRGDANGVSQQLQCHMMTYILFSWASAENCQVEQSLFPHLSPASFTRNFSNLKSNYISCGHLYCFLFGQNTANQLSIYSAFSRGAGVVEFPLCPMHTEVLEPLSSVSCVDASCVISCSL